MGSDLGAVTRDRDFHTIPVREKHPCHGCTKLNFTVDDGCEPLDPFRDEKIRQEQQKVKK